MNDPLRQWAVRELCNRRQAVQLRGAQAQATVGLIRALGGGWEEG